MRDGRRLIANIGVLAGRFRGCPRPPDQRGRGGGGWPGRQRGRDPGLVRGRRGHPGPRAVPVHRPRVRGPAAPPAPDAVHRRLRPRRCRRGDPPRGPGRQQPTVLHRGGLGPRGHAPHGLRPAATAPDRRVPPPRLEPASGRRGDGPRAPHARADARVRGFREDPTANCRENGWFRDAVPRPRPVPHARGCAPVARRAGLARRALPELRLHLDARPPQRGDPGDVRRGPVRRDEAHRLLRQHLPRRDRGRDRDDPRAPGGPHRRRGPGRAGAGAAPSGQPAPDAAQRAAHGAHRGARRGLDARQPAAVGRPGAALSRAASGPPRW